AEVRRGPREPKLRPDFFVEPVLRVCEVEAREQRILLEQKVGDRRAVEQIELRYPAQLVDALEQESELCGKRIARHVFVEAREERILLGALEQRLDRA